MELIYRVMRASLYDLDPFSDFRIMEYADKVRSDFKKTTIFQDLVQKHFIPDDGNKIKFTMKPDKKFEEEKIKEQINNFSNVLKNFSANEIKKTMDDLDKFYKRMNEKDSINALPKIKPEEISIKEEYQQFKKINLDNGIPIWQFNTLTNGVIHLKIKFDTSVVPAYLRNYIPIFS